MIAVDERRLKGLLKIAVTEVLEERQDLLSDAVREGMEDIAMTRAIQIGEKTPLTTRKKILQKLSASQRDLSVFPVIVTPLAETVAQAR